jgi:hypothetical protein
MARQPAHLAPLLADARSCRANVLRMMLRRRDHELSKLVMRVVSLQELINQGGHLQPSISRYTRFEGATVSATYM